MKAFADIGLNVVQILWFVCDSINAGNANMLSFSHNVL